MTDEPLLKFTKLDNVSLYSEIGVNKWKEFKNIF